MQNDLEKIKNLTLFFEKEKYVILFLFILHYPSHPYDIARSFKKINRSKLIDLSYSNKVASFLNKMKAQGLVQSKTLNNRKVYSVNLDFIDNGVIFPEIYTKNSLGGFSSLTSDFIISCVKLVNKSSKPKNKDSLLKSITNIKKLDFIAVCLYIYEIVSFLSEYYSTRSFLVTHEEDEEIIKKVKSEIRNMEMDSFFNYLDFEKIITGQKSLFIRGNVSDARGSFEEALSFLRDLVFSIEIIERLEKEKYLSIKRKKPH